MASEQNTAQWTKLLQQVLTEPCRISQAYRRFHNYSLRNQLLAMVQCEAREIPLGPIGTFMHWKELGRFVKKGEKAIQLCMPVTYKGKSVEDESGNEFDLIGTAYTRFVFKNNWFVMSQTDGDDYTPEALPAWDATAALTKLDIELVPFTSTNGNVQGYSLKRTVAVSPIAQQATLTLLHEIAHVVLGHTAEVMKDSGERTPKDIRELEAECTAMLVAASLELPGVEECRHYVQSYFKGNEVPERSAQRIFGAADKILKAGETKVVVN